MGGSYGCLTNNHEVRNHDTVIKDKVVYVQGETNLSPQKISDPLIGSRSLHAIAADMGWI